MFLVLYFNSVSLKYHPTTTKKKKRLMKRMCKKSRKNNLTPNRPFPPATPLSCLILYQPANEHGWEKYCPYPQDLKIHLSKKGKLWEIQERYAFFC